MDAKTLWPADRVERRPLAALVPNARNARTHSPGQVSAIAESMREWGWTNPVLVDEGGAIIAGHGRVLAAVELGFADVPVMVAEGWSEPQKRAYALADNQLALNAGWDAATLSAEMRGLAEWNFDLSLIGFADLDALLGADAAELGAMPWLPDGAKPPFVQVTFTLHDDQAGVVEAALAAAKNLGAFVDTINENSNGNALARICEMFVANHT